MRSPRRQITDTSSVRPPAATRSPAPGPWVPCHVLPGSLECTQYGAIPLGVSCARTAPGPIRGRARARRAALGAPVSQIDDTSSGKRWGLASAHRPALSVGVAATLWAVCSGAGGAGAQGPSTDAARRAAPAWSAPSQDGTSPRPLHAYRYPVHLGPSDRSYWLAAGGALVSGVLLDRTARPVIRGERTPFLDRIAPIGDVFGTAKYTVPTVTSALIAAQISRNADWEDATRHITLSYIVGDVTEAAVKGAVGRQRPHYSGDPWRMRPLSLADEWHSFPSGHVTHITAIAAALAEEVHRPWATVLSAGAVVLTGWQRIYRDQHWASDVIGGAIVGTAASRITAHWLRHRLHVTAGASPPPT